VSALLDTDSGGLVLYDEPAPHYFRRELHVASNSGLKILDEQSALHYYHWVTHPENDERTAALDFGHAYHAASLEPEQFARTYCVLPDDAPSRPTSRQINAKKPSPSTLEQIDWWQRWEDDHAGRVCLPAKVMDQIRGMADALRSHALRIPSGGRIITIRGDELFAVCRTEVTRYWTDPRTGVRCKSRTDLDCQEFAFGGDLKSTVDASPDGFARAVVRYRYHQQEAHYTEGAKATGAPWPNFLFFVSEKEPPYAPAVYTIPAMAEERGHFLRNRALDKLRRCLETNTWPGYSDTITELVLPAYAFYDAND
jgi:hypothetical protein